MRSPHALQMPLMILEDEEINKRFRRFNLLNRTSEVFATLPLVYLALGSVGLTEDINNNLLAFAFFGIASGSAGLTLYLLAHRQLSKGVNRYNQLILAPSSKLLGLSARYRF